MLPPSKAGPAGVLEINNLSAASFVAPYKFMNAGVEHMKKVIMEKLVLFNKLS